MAKNNKAAHREADKRLELLLWHKYLKDTNSDAFYPLFADQSRFLVLKGGGSSGKSIFAGRKILERCVSEEGHRFLVCRKTARSIKNSCFTQLLGQLSKHYPDVPYKANKNDMSIYFPKTNSEIIFSGLDDVEKLKSIYNITGIWIEEASEILESDLHQLNIRMRGESKYYKQIIITFNPVNILHWLKARFFDKPQKNTTIHESTYKDNKFLPEEDRQVLENFKEQDEYYYNVYCLGNWGVSGKTVFNARELQERIAFLPEAKRVGMMAYDYDGLRIRNVRFEDDKNGCIRIYKEPDPKHTYVIGGDTAGEGSDSCVLQVIDAITLEQVAILRDQDMNEDIFAWQAYSLGMFYNTALIAIEANWSTYPIMELERLRYPKQYVRESIDRFTHDIKQSFGFRTDSKTRPVIIANLIKVLREDVNVINDLTTISEALTFVRNKDTYNPEAEEGAHDDTIMALAIACYCRNSGQVRLSPYENGDNTERNTEWTEDMYEDYRNASFEDRKILIERWGKPKRWQ